MAFNTITAKHFREAPRSDSGVGTGQYHETSLPGGEGLYIFGARWYDPKLARFVSADTIVPDPGNPQDLNRYTYVRNNPLRYTDPTGHIFCEDCTGGAGHYGGGGGNGGYHGSGGGSSSFGETETVRPTYFPRVSAFEAWSLVFSWFFEVGPRTWYFGPESSLTQDIMYDPGIDQFRRVWQEAGYPVPFRYEHTADIREGKPLPVRAVSGGWIFLREHLIQLPLSTIGLGSKDPQGQIDPVGGIIGSLDQIEVADAGIGMVRFMVHNVTGWESGTRIPGTSNSFIQDRNRDAWGPGGTIEQYFYWWEPMPWTNGLTVVAQ